MKRIAIITSLVLAAFAAGAQMKTTKVSIFKSGVYFQKKEGGLKFNDRAAHIDVPQNALLGTYWIAGGKDAKVLQIDVRQDTVKKTKEATNMYQFIQGNEGKQITLRYNQLLEKEKPTTRVVTGTLLRYFPMSGVMKIKTPEGKILIISINNLNDVEFEASMNDRFPVDTIMRRAKILLEKQIAESPFTVVSMQTGIQWQPSYFIKLINEKEARIMMKGTVENMSGEDLNEVDLDLVVGSPQMFFGTQLDPVSLNYLTNLTTTSYGYLDNNRSGNLYYNNASQAVSYDYAVTETVPIAGDEEYTTEGEKVADLYYYKAGRVSLKKNTKTMIPITLATIPYKDVYEAEISDITNYYINRTVTYDEMQRTDAFHSLKFTNKMSAPITTASVFVVDEDEKPIAQDQIKYTSINSDVMVRLSKAIDVSVKSKDEETGKREEKAKKYNKVFYDKITLKGTIDVANFLDKPITLSLKKYVNGEVTKADGATVTKTGRYNQLNPYSTVKWEVDLKAGEKKTINFEYEVYITTGY